VLLDVRTTAWQVSTNCQIFLIKSVLYAEVNKVENLLDEFNSFVLSEVLLTVQSTSHQAIQFELCTTLISRALALISYCKC
jgi:hypothetical protein